MMDAETRNNVQQLNPFGFLSGQASAIRPLGGDVRSPDPRYVFHTPYVEFKPGRVAFTIRFDQLQASFGELRIDINAFIPGSGRDALFVTSARLNLADKASVDRDLTISIMSIAGAAYAAYGFCMEGTDAWAAGLMITAEQTDAPEDVNPEGFLLPTALGNAPLDMQARLVGDGTPRFCDPVSQTMTADQLAETGYQQWIARLPNRPQDERLRWKLAFIAQVLDRYAILRPGGRGIALGDDCALLAPVIAAAGCEALLASLPPDHGASDFAWSAVSCTPLDAVGSTDGAPGIPLSLADQPADARGFDFLWSIGMAQLGYEAGHCGNFLFELMSVLRPGGYAVHMLDLDARAEAGAHTLPRAEVERLAVTLISRGFSVAQLNFSGIADAQTDVPFGLIVRKD